MAWMPGIKKMELEPESTNQVAINPTQFIMHSIAAPWSRERMYEYWDDSTNLESHFGVSYDGGIAQFIGTQTRADANASANNRAVSVETASNLQHTDPWTEAQIKSLIEIGVWLHKQHGIPLRICRSWTDPGYGYHGLFKEWSISGTACPGDARIKQFKTRVFPGIVAAVNGTTEDDEEMTPEEKKLLEQAANPINPWRYRNASAEAEAVKKGTHIPDAYGYLVGTNYQMGLLRNEVKTLTELVAKLVAKS